MKTNLLFPTAAVALLSLAACNTSPEEVTSIAPDPMKAELENRAPVELPPSIEATVTMRCKDNSLVYLDFFKGATQVRLKTEKDGAATTLKAGTAGEPYVAEGGYKVAGNAKSATVVAPGKSEITCRAG